MCSNLGGVQSTGVLGVMMVSAVIHRTSDTFVTFFHETQASFLIASQTENKTAAFFCVPPATIAAEAKPLQV